MTSNRRFSQAPPDKANELFEKLLATSNNALKTRERLFADLKEELELLAALQEEHLFPILRRHGMQDLAQDASNDNAETAALLAALEAMPKTSSEFLGQVAQLRRVFQQHLRDDKQELLPAVLEVLSDDEAMAVAERVEDEMASIDEMKRAEARRARTQGDAAQQVTEDIADTVRAGVEGAQAVAQTVHESLQSSLGTVSEMARRSTDQAVRLFGLPNGDGQDVTRQATENLRAVAQSGTVLTRGLQEVSREWVELSQKRWQKNLDGLQALARCRSMSDLVAVQSSLWRDHLEQTLDNSRRLAELTITMADEAARATTVQADKTAQRLRSVA